jgi:hypothetical protein
MRPLIALAVQVVGMASYDRKKTDGSKQNNVDVCIMPVLSCDEECLKKCGKIENI